MLYYKTYLVNENESYTKADAETEAPILWKPVAKNWLIGKDPDTEKDWRQEEKGTLEDEMVGWLYRLDGQGFEQAPGVGDGQGGLVCSHPVLQKVWHSWVTELNWTDTEAYTKAPTQVIKHADLYTTLSIGSRSSFTFQDKTKLRKIRKHYYF